MNLVFYLTIENFDKFDNVLGKITKVWRYVIKKYKYLANI